jgi:hypothetical protein
MTVYKLTALKEAEEFVKKLLESYWTSLDGISKNLEDTALSCWTAEDGGGRDITLYALKRLLNSDKNRLDTFATNYGKKFAVRYGPLYHYQLQGLITSLGNIVTHINTLVQSNYWDSSAGKAHVSEVSQTDRDQLASDIDDELSPAQLPEILIQDVTASGGVSITGDFMQVRGDGSAVTVTATPSIETEAIQGHILVLQGASNSNTLTLQDESSLSGSKLELDGAANVTLGLGDTLVLIYNSTTGKYYQISTCDN